LRLVHLSDTHLGFGTYSKVDEAQGINLREADFYSAFQQAIDKTIELRPDAVVHAGDLFDTVRPQNRAIDFALRQIIRLSEAGIETVMISGNHSTPKLRETGNIFRIFEHLDHVHSIHEPGIAKVVVGDMTVHAIPHSTSPSIAQLVSELRPSKDTKHNVAVLHAGILSPEMLYKMDEFNEESVPKESLPSDFDYIAIGHYHKYAKVAPNAYYSGSTERLGFGEADQTKGVVEVDLDTGKVTLHPLKTRDMMDLEKIDAARLVSSEIAAEARARISASSIDGKIVRLVISNVSAEAYRSMDVPSIRRMGGSAMHFELKIDRAEEAGRRASEDAQIGSLTHEFHKYVSGLDLPEDKRKALLEIGAPYFAREEE
jgi:DNA repair exonuclease SbcCD nuclease subunit